jgi:hypothetical protein
MDLEPRVIAAVGLLAIVPAIAYAATQPDQLSGLVAAVNVVLISGSLALALRPVNRGVVHR